MSLVPDQAAFREFARTSDIVPVCLDLMADLETPVSVYARLRSQGASFLFESVTGGEHIGRYSFCGAGPALTITSWEDRTEKVYRDGRKESFPTPADPLELVKRKSLASASPKSLACPLSSAGWSAWSATNTSTAPSPRSLVPPRTPRARR